MPADSQSRHYYRRLPARTQPSHKNTDILPAKYCAADE